MRIGPEIVICWAKEIVSLFSGKRVTDVTGKDNWIIITFAKKDRLLFSWSPVNSGVCLIEPDEFEFLDQAGKYVPSVTSFLSRHLLNCTLKDALQIDRDRILKVMFEKKVSAGVSVEYDLILEAVGPKSNFVIADRSGRILEAAKHIPPFMNSYRSIVPDHEYCPPPPFNGLSTTSFKEDPTPENIKNIKGIGRDLSDIVQGSLTLHGIHHWAELFDRIYNYPDSCVLQRCNNLLTVFPEILPGCSKSADLALEAGKKNVVEPMVEKLSGQIISRIMKYYKKRIKSLQRHLDGLNSKKDHSAQAEEFRKMGDLIISNIYRISRGQRSVTLDDLEDMGAKVEIDLDPKLSPSENAQRYYKKYKKYKKNVKGLDNKIFNLSSRIEELVEQKETIDLVDDPLQIMKIAEELKITYRNTKKRKKEEKYKPPHLKRALGDHVILVGLNARGNRYVTFEEAGPEDIWFHAYEVPGSHVILKIAGKKEEDNEMYSQAVEVAASLAAYYSRSRNAGKVRIVYTAKKNVRPIKGGGLAQVTYYYPESIFTTPDLWKEYFEDRQQGPGEEGK